MTYERCYAPPLSSWEYIICAFNIELGEVNLAERENFNVVFLKSPDLEYSKTCSVGVFLSLEKF